MSRTIGLYYKIMLAPVAMVWAAALLVLVVFRVIL